MANVMDNFKSWLGGKKQANPGSPPPSSKQWKSWSQNSPAQKPSQKPSHSHAPGHSCKGGHDHAHEHGHSHSELRGAPNAQKNSQGQTAEAVSGLRLVKNIIAVASGKGGVGKSTVAVNLALSLKNQGAAVGLLDADIYGPCQPGLLGVSPKDENSQLKTTSQGAIVPVIKQGVPFVSMGLLLDSDKPVIWRAPMVMKLMEQFLKQVEWGYLDYLIVDLPPGTGDIQLSLAQQTQVSGAIIVTTPQDVALGIARKGLEMLKTVKVPILGVVENMSGYHCEACGHENNIFKSGGAEKMAAELELPLLAKIPLDSKIVEASDAGRPVVLDSQGAEYTGSPAAKAYRELSLSVIRLLTKEGTSELEPERAYLNPNGDLRVDWNDGHKGIHRGYFLRCQCPCASCVDEMTGKKRLDDKMVPLNLKILEVQSVGRYALTVIFSDSHSTGIYTYDRLRSLCECDLCVNAKHPEREAFSV